MLSSLKYFFIFICLLFSCLSFSQTIISGKVFDAKTKELVWQGEGSGYLTTNTEKKDARIKEFVSKILEQYPPK